jgi:hypothetical protein
MSFQYFSTLNEKRERYTFRPDVNQNTTHYATTLLNNRARKVLQYKTPIEVFFGYEALSTGECTFVALQI